MTAVNNVEKEAKALHILRRGIQSSPELQKGLGATITVALLSSLGRLILPVVVQQTIDRGITTPNVDVVITFTSFAAAILLVVVVLDRVAMWRVMQAAENALSNLRVRAFAHIHQLSMAEHTESQRGQLTARVTSDTETLARFMQWGGVTWIRESAVVVGAIVAMTWYSWQLTILVVAIYIPLLPLLRHIQRKQLDAYNEVRTNVGATLGAASESVTGAATIRAYGYQQPIADQLQESNRQLADSQIQAHKYFAALSPTIDLFGGVAIGAVIVAGVLLQPGELSVGQLGAFLFLLTVLVSPIAQLGEVLDQTQTALAGWWKIQQLFAIKPDVVEPASETANHLPSTPPAIRFDAVSFSYRTGEQVLHDLSFEIPAGSSIALVGETGSGKTTVAKLMARLADPTSGKIHIGGFDLTGVSAASRNQAIRMVPQDGFLFDTTIEENILFGRPDATVQDITEATTKLGLTDWMNSLPAGLQTQVGERGDNISVGERQLIALIRAQVANTGLLILDEATSSVDPEIEQQLVAALEHLSHNRTTVSVAHRLSTAEKADLILVLGNGRLVETGNHNQLLSRPQGRYRDLYQSWVGNTQ